MIRKQNNFMADVLLTFSHVSGLDRRSSYPQYSLKAKPNAESGLNAHRNAMRVSRGEEDTENMFEASFFEV